MAKKKIKMRDLSVSPDTSFNIQYEVQKREEKLRKQMLIRDAYNERFSMFRTKKLAVFWLVGGTMLAFVLIHIMNVILTSAGYPTAIPL
jgi:hypothetical protein